MGVAAGGFIVISGFVFRITFLSYTTKKYKLLVNGLFKFNIFIYLERHLGEMLVKTITRQLQLVTKRPMFIAY